MFFLQKLVFTKRNFSLSLFSSIFLQKKTTLRSIFCLLFLAMSFTQTVGATEEEAPLMSPTQHSERGYTVHYSVFNSHFIPADIARAYQLIRGKNHVLVNVVLTQTGKESQTFGLAAKVSGAAKNLMQQRQPLKFQTINEENTTYFLAPLRITNEEVFHFEIQVTPPDNSKPITIKFSKKLYVDA